MIGHLLNPLVRQYLDYRWNKLSRFGERPQQCQIEILDYLLRKARNTKFGSDHSLETVHDYQDFSQAVPVRSYDELLPYIDRSKSGESDVLWPGVTRMFSKSSGTTARSKYIPVTSENMRRNHLHSSWDCLAVLYHHAPDMDVFRQKNLVLPGSLEEVAEHPSAKAGDISALLIDQMPNIARPFYEPDFDLALSPDWESKIEKVAQLAEQMKDVVLIAGVPTWNLVLFRRILEVTRREHILEVWPQLRVYFHGGVGFGPYRHVFEEYLPRTDFIYQEIYNASEGLFAVQDVQDEDMGMLLLLSNGVFYEFIALDEYTAGKYHCVPLWEVELGVQYVMIISTNSGLWRYELGDVVEFVTLHPHRIRIMGRTTQYINAFGEELMVHNAEKALDEVCNMESARIKDYTVAPRYLEAGKRGAHEWFIEWDIEPSNLGLFAERLDAQLRTLNSDYDAKRSHDLALTQLSIISVKSGTFYKWMEHRGRVGSQTKVPRLSNDRRCVEELLTLMSRH